MIILKQQRKNLTRKEIILLIVVSSILIITIPLALNSIKVTNPSPVKTEEKVPKGAKTALTKAKNYADVMHMSKQDISDQLNSGANDKYSKAAINYALKHLKINYDKNALLRAKEYSDSQNMSKLAIHDQLTNKGKFTSEQARYAVDNLQVDYNQNALITARAYQRDLHFSPATIRNVLVSNANEKFTPEEADYAILHLND
ncbi:hypothetical protein IV57_GL001631 [Companilactobacillus kimchiensis]|uniref:Putative host cell surface-exposed lipoprotein Ltp-like HTH region domain-containing protein n=1 Tax=Companilactobacillus kimchiensis TaxID=993692 RepID=A0A0R2L7H9_9LACO|nr:hypothetical protein IV57_GL001631 [Companilactobacillus kimchiensis]